MRAQVFVLSLFVCAAAPAYAQHWGLQAPGRAVSNMGIIEYQSRDWSQCTGAEQAPAQRAISACGRIIGERVSRDVTASAHYYRSVLYRQAGDASRADADVNRAIELLREFVQANPEDAEALNNLVFLRAEKRDFAGAAADYAAVAARNPQAVEPRLQQGAYLFRAGDYISAIAAFDAASQLDPTNAQAHSGRCEARAAANRDLAIAEQACGEALRLSGQGAGALFSRGFFHFSQGRVEEALSDFEAAGRKDNTYPFAAYGYAVASLRLGRFQAQATELLTNVTSAVPEVEMYAQAGMRP